MTTYDNIGDNYNATRHADERITHQILSLLSCSPPCLIADIGAGTGNYSYELARRDYTVHALEPSATMQAQRKTHINLEWFKGHAEDIPFQDNYYDGALCTMSTHHFSSLELSLLEIYRILKGKGVLVIFTADLREAEEQCWLREYFPCHCDRADIIHPPLERFMELLESIFGKPASMTPFPLPHNLKDEFFFSAWRYPEKYLNEDFRKGISCFALAEKDDTQQAVLKLKQDLESGEWDRRYGFFREREFLNGGYFFLSVEK